MLSKMLKLKDHINSQREKVFIKIEKSSPVTERLKLLSRHQQTRKEQGTVLRSFSERVFGLFIGDF
ncbi:MAG: hypothetical protein WBC45_06080 [Atribacterota bacterium]